MPGPPLVSVGMRVGYGRRRPGVIFSDDAVSHGDVVVAYVFLRDPRSRARRVIIIVIGGGGVRERNPANEKAARQAALYGSQFDGFAVARCPCRRII